MFELSYFIGYIICLIVFDILILFNGFKLNKEEDFKLIKQTPEEYFETKKLTKTNLLTKDNLSMPKEIYLIGNSKEMSLFTKIIVVNILMTLVFILVVFMDIVRSVKLI